MSVFALSFKGLPLRLFNTNELDHGELLGLQTLARNRNFSLDRIPSDRSQMPPPQAGYDNLKDIRDWRARGGQPHNYQKATELAKERKPRGVNRARA